jgi:hypothetical protein
MALPMPYLREAMPDFASELRSFLYLGGYAELCPQVDSLKVVDRCRCNAEDCATFYTEPKPNGAWGDGHRNLVLPTQDFDLIVDVVHDRIVCVEILERPDVKQMLDSILGSTPSQKSEDGEQGAEPNRNAE